MPLYRTTSLSRGTPSSSSSLLLHFRRGNNLRRMAQKSRPDHLPPKHFQAEAAVDGAIHPHGLDDVGQREVTAVARHNRAEQVVQAVAMDDVEVVQRRARKANDCRDSK